MGAIAATTIALAATGCGDDDTPGTVTVEGKPYVEAMREGLLAHGAGSVTVDATAATCIAPKWVNILGPERLDAAGVAPSRLTGDDGLDVTAAKVALTDAQVSKLVDAFGECEVDLPAAFVHDLTRGASPSPEDEACLIDAVPTDLVQRIVGMQITEGDRAPDRDPELVEELFTALSACPGAIDLGS